ncbi:hypothetical protein HT031_003103 [Scenedesmus sp. PABB004]|nr:hypothetical protein HT031_003103 [Scenedesmus sp. PABB004]
MALARMFSPFVEWAATRYRASLASNLKQYGLRYDDLYDPMMDLDVAEALRRLPADVVVARNARLKRAMDLSLKGTTLPEDLQAKQTPFASYLQDTLDEIKAERTERAQLGAPAPALRAAGIARTSAALRPHLETALAHCHGGWDAAGGSAVCRVPGLPTPDELLRWLLAQVAPAAQAAGPSELDLQLSAAPTAVAEASAPCSGPAPPPTAAAAAVAAAAHAAAKPDGDGSSWRERTSDGGDILARRAAGAPPGAAEPPALVQARLGRCSAAVADAPSGGACGGAATEALVAMRRHLQATQAAIAARGAAGGGDAAAHALALQQLLRIKQLKLAPHQRAARERLALAHTGADDVAVEVLQARHALAAARATRNAAVREWHKREAAEAQRRREAAAAARVAALRGASMGEYLALLAEAKNSRLAEVLRQTDDCLRQLAAKLGMDAPDAAGALDGGGAGVLDATAAIGGRAAPGPTHGAAPRAQGLCWLVGLSQRGLNGILADDMGLGKTVQVIALVCHCVEARPPGARASPPFLVVCPASVLSNWAAECARWAPGLAVVQYKGSAEARGEVWARQVAGRRVDVVLTTYELLMAPADRARLVRIKWAGIVVDEGHRLKNAECKLAQELRGYTSTSRLLLTGTPLQNKLAELWSLLNFLMPEVFSSADDFDAWFGAPLQAIRDAGGAAAAAVAGSSAEADLLSQEEYLLVSGRLHAVLRPFMLRRLKEAVATELPPKREVVLRVPISPYQAALYDLVRTKFRDGGAPGGGGGGGGGSGARGVNNTVMELRNICNHPALRHGRGARRGSGAPRARRAPRAAAAQTAPRRPRAPPRSKLHPEFGEDLLLDAGGGSGGDGAAGPAKLPAVLRLSAKLDLLDQVLVRLAACGHKVLLFCTMTRALDLVEEYAAWRGWTWLRLDGATSGPERAEAVSRFNDPASGVFMFMLSLRAGGVGLNLQAADTVAQARAHRIGQQRDVLVVRLLVESSIEEHVLAVAQQKRKFADSSITGAPAARPCAPAPAAPRARQLTRRAAPRPGGFFDGTTSAEVRRQYLLAILEGKEPAGGGGASGSEPASAGAASGARGGLTAAALNALLARGKGELALLQAREERLAGAGAAACPPPWELPLSRVAGVAECAELIAAARQAAAPRAKEDLSTYGRGMRGAKAADAAAQTEAQRRERQAAAAAAQPRAAGARATRGAGAGGARGTAAAAPAPPKEALAAPRAAKRKLAAAAAAAEPPAAAAAEPPAAAAAEPPAAAAEPPAVAAAEPPSVAAAEPAAAPAPKEPAAVLTVAPKATKEQGAAPAAMELALTAEEAAAAAAEGPVAKRARLAAAAPLSPPAAAEEPAAATATSSESARAAAASGKARQAAGSGGGADAAALAAECARSGRRVLVVLGTARGMFDPARGDVLLLPAGAQPPGEAPGEARAGERAAEVWLNKTAFMKHGGQGHKHDAAREIRLAGHGGVTLGKFSALLREAQQAQQAQQAQRARGGGRQRAPRGAGQGQSAAGGGAPALDALAAAAAARGGDNDEEALVAASSLLALPGAAPAAAELVAAPAAPESAAALTAEEPAAAATAEVPMPKRARLVAAPLSPPTAAEEPAAATATSSESARAAAPSGKARQAAGSGGGADAAALAAECARSSGRRVLVVVGTARGMFDPARGDVLLLHGGAQPPGEAPGEAPGDAPAGEQAAEVWLNKTAFMKHGGQGHKHDATREIRLAGHGGVTLGKFSALLREAQQAQQAQRARGGGRQRAQRGAGQGDEEALVAAGSLLALPAAAPVVEAGGGRGRKRRSRGAPASPGVSTPPELARD